MKFTKIAAVALCGAMLLSGCSFNFFQKPANTAEDSAAVSGDDVMSVGNVGVSKGVFTLFFKSYNAQTTDSEQAKELTLDECEKGYQRIAVAKAMNVEFDSETQEEIDNQKNQVIANYGGQEGYEEFLNENDMTSADVDTIISMGYYTQELKNKMNIGEITDETKREYFKNHYRRAKHVLVSISGDTDDETAKAKAEEVLEKAKNGEDFDALIKEYGEDPGMSTNPDGYVFTDNTMVKEFQDGVDSIKQGEFTMVKTSYGYHVIERLDLEETPDYFEEAYQNAEDELDSVVSNGLFEDQLAKWVEEYNIKTVRNDGLIDAIVNKVTSD